MRSLFVVFIFLQAITLVSQGLDYAALTIPAELRENANSVIRQHEKIYQVTSPSEASVYERKVITILNGNHNSENQMVVYYDGDSKITKFNATLFDAFGEKVRSAKKSEIEDVRALSDGQFYTDSRVQTTTIEHLTYPFTVEFEYEKVMKGFAIVDFPSWMPLKYEQSVQQSSFTAHVPTDNELLYHLNQLPEPQVSAEDGNKVYSWSVEMLPANRREANMPPLSQAAPYLRTGLRNFNIDDYEGTLDNWQAFGAFIGKLMEGRSILPDQLKSLVQETTAGLTTDKEKIDALYRLMQDRTRYVGVQLGIGGWQPFSAEYVETNRYGDCKALSNYMGAMLSEVGIEAYPVLVNSSETPFFPVDESFTTSAFNHMILYVPGEEMYLECTSKLAPTGYLGEGTDDRNVLWITPDGGKLAHTPSLPAADNSHLRTVSLKINVDGSTDFTLAGHFYGATQGFLRYFASAEHDEAKQRERLNQRGMLPDIGGDTYRLEVETDAPVAHLNYETSLPSYTRKLGKRMFVSINKFYAYDYVPDKVEERKFPIVRNKARFYVDTVHLVYPNTMEIESLGESVTKISHAAGEYRSEISARAGQLTWVRTLKLLPVHLPATAYNDYRQFFIDVAKADKRKVVLREKRTR
ncbi:MAG: transglutaminase-like putative cysteine protease [Neolewinella sp.]|jgi:transglutaminase-like putative cysteine protease